MNSNTAGADVCKIDAALNGLGQTVSFLHEMINQLEGRLQSVLEPSPSIPQNSAVMKSATAVKPTLIADRLKALNDGISLANKRLDSFSGRLHV